MAGLVQAKTENERDTDINLVVDRLCGSEVVSRVARLATLKLLDGQITGGNPAHSKVISRVARRATRNLLEGQIAGGNDGADAASIEGVGLDDQHGPPATGPRGAPGRLRKPGVLRGMRRTRRGLDRLSQCH